MTEAPKSLKNSDLQRYYDRLFEMHGSLGWAEFMTDVEQMEAEHNNLDTIDTAEDLWRRKGQLEIIRWLRSHKERVEAAYAHILEEEAGEGAAPEATGGVAKVV